MHDALAGVVVGVGEQDVPVVRKGVWVDGEAVVLAGDEAAIRSVMDARLVVATVSVPEILNEQQKQNILYLKIKT